MLTKYLMVVLAAISVSNAFLYITADLASYAAVKEPSFFPPDDSISPIEKDKLYSDFLFSNGSKVYVIEVLEEKSILIFSFTIDTENATLEVNLQGPLDRMRLSIIRDPRPYIYYAESRGEVRIVITNHQRDIVHYKFFVDISEPLADNNWKILLLESGQVAFHTDLKRDDRVFLNLDYSNYFDLRIRVFALCYAFVLGKSSYMLCLYRESLNKTLYFTADLGGRYYVIVESVKAKGTFSLTSIITSPPWNQEWFWPVFNITFMTIISLFFLTKIKKTRNLEKTTLFALVGYYCWFITIGLSTSVIGSFNYGTSIYIFLFYLSIFFYSLSLGVQVYAAYLDRKKTTAVCPYCGKKVDLKKDNCCCGKIVKNISVAWFLMPFSLSFLCFIASYLIFERIFPEFISTSLWIGSCGSIIGGTIAWWINRNIHRKKPWKFLATGIIFSFFSPLLTGFLIDMSFRPCIELELPGKLMRIRIAPLTLPPGITFTFSILAIALGFLIVDQIRKIRGEL